MDNFADQCLERTKDYIKNSYNSNVLSHTGNFGGLFKFNTKEYKEPILVSSIDGVGTKLTFAVDFLKNQTIKYNNIPHFNIGVDIVNHCVNDIAVQGAKPLFFLDYFSTSKTHPSVFENLMSGMSWACQKIDCPIVGGEIAHMPGFYQKDIYELAGAMVGVVDKSNLVTGSEIKHNDVIIGVSSSGLHTNGYSVVRSTLLDIYDLNSTFEELESSLGEVLLEPHRCYYDLIQKSIESYEVRGIAHITGGGIIGNVSRIIPQGLEAQIDWQSWEWPPIFKLISERSEPKIEDMKSIFNLGVGLVFIVHKNVVESFLSFLGNYYEAFVIGKVHEKN